MEKLVNIVDVWHTQCWQVVHFYNTRLDWKTNKIEKKDVIEGFGNKCQKLNIDMFRGQSDTTM